MKIRKVILINPPTSAKITKEGRVIMPLSITFEPPRMPLSMALIAGGLLEAKIEVEIIDAISEVIDLDEVEKRIISFAPDLAIINCSTPTLEDDLKVLYLAKRNNSRCAFFGQHVDALAEETMGSYQEIDYAFLKDPEIVAKNFVLSYNSNVDLRTVEGLVFRENDTIIKTNGTLDTPLDDFPTPARHLLKNDLYRLPDGKKYSVILSSRGCPFECPFCEASEYHGKNVRRRTPVSLVNEIENVIEKYNIRSFLLQSDLFTSNKQWAISVCDEIIKRNISIRWISNTRVDTIDLELLEKMKLSGCFLLGMGIESGSKRMLEVLKKNVSLEQVKHAISMCRKVGIKTSCSFVVGFPGETLDSLRETENLIMEAAPDFVVLMTAYPFPGTKLYKMLMNKKTPYKFNNGWEKNCFTGVSIGGIEAELELKRFCRKMIFKHFFRFKFFYNQRWLLNNPTQLLAIIFYTIKKMPLMMLSFRDKKT